MCWRRMAKIKWSEKVTNEEVLECVVEKKTLQNSILRRKLICIAHILRRVILLHDAIEREMIELKEIGRRKTQFFMICGTEEDFGS